MINIRGYLDCNILFFSSVNEENRAFLRGSSGIYRVGQLMDYVVKETPIKIERGASVVFKGITWYL